MQSTIFNCIIEFRNLRYFEHLLCQLERSNTFHIRVKDRISSARHRKSLQKAFPIIHGKAKVHRHNTYRKYNELLLGQQNKPQATIYPEFCPHPRFHNCAA